MINLGAMRCLQGNRLRPIMLKNLPIMLLSIAQKIAHYAHVKELCLKSDCSIRVYLLVSKMVSVLLEYIMFIISMLSVLLE